MLTIETAQGMSLPITWIGISELDGSLRFETSEPNMATLFSIFSDPEHTRILTRVFDENETVFEGYTDLFRIERMPSGIVIGLRRPA